MNENKNRVAINQLKSWLKALGIEFVSVTDGVNIKSVTGTLVTVRVIVPGVEIGVADVDIDAADFTGRDIGHAFKTFRALVEILGHTWRPPIDRGELPSDRKARGLSQHAHVDEEFDLVAFCHTQLHRVPNPSRADLVKYERLIREECRRFYGHYTEECDDNMLSMEDLQQYALVWTTIYISRYECENPDENGRLFRAFMRQRLQNFRKDLYKKGRNVFAHLDEAHIALTGEPWQGSDLKKPKHGDIFDLHGPCTDDTWASVDPTRDDTAEEYVTTHRQLDTSSPNARRKSASAMLDGLLSQLPHDRLVQVLTDTVDNNRICPDARREAAARLKEHSKSCHECLALELQVQDEMAGEDGLSAQE